MSNFTDDQINNHDSFIDFCLISSWNESFDSSVIWILMIRVQMFLWSSSHWESLFSLTSDLWSALFLSLNHSLSLVSFRFIFSHKISDDDLHISDECSDDQCLHHDTGGNNRYDHIFIMFENTTSLIKYKFILQSVFMIKFIGHFFIYKRSDCLFDQSTDPVGWGCVLVFLQILWTVMKFTDATFIFLRFNRGTVLIIISVWCFSPSVWVHVQLNPSVVHDIKPAGPEILIRFVCLEETHFEEKYLSLCFIIILVLIVINLIPDGNGWQTQWTECDAHRYIDWSH